MNDISADKLVMSQTILCAHVSTAERTLAHQRTQAESEGSTFDVVVADHGESGRKPSSERPEGRRQFDLLRRGDTLVVLDYRRPLCVFAGSNPSAVANWDDWRCDVTTLQEAKAFIAALPDHERRWWRIVNWTTGAVVLQHMPGERHDLH